MDMKSWPWKKKSSDKKAAVIASNALTDGSDTSATQVDKVKQEKPKYVQISMESYMHLTGLENQVNSYEEQVVELEDKVNELNEKLSEANLEMTNKENLVKQHAKVAEEAVSGWEKAEAEAAALKNHLESVTLLKLTAEDKASHLDGALKECMRQIRSLKDEYDKQLHEVVLNKTKLFDKMKLNLEANIANLERELRRSAAENSTLSKSLHERSNMLIQLSEEKSQAEAEIERLKANIESCEKEINSLRYEVHVAKMEVEIRNEEKNMSMRSAEVANKQHIEAVKKITKLEAECQRLRGLVRKRLPGPAALAQMKLEVENFGREYGEHHVRRSPVKISTAPSSPQPEFSLNETQKYVKENELLTERLLAMEEETKMLKEALANRNSELQDSRGFCGQVVSKLQALEAQLQVSGGSRRLPKSDMHPGSESLCSKAINAPSCTSMSEDGNDDNASGTGSWSTGLISEDSRNKKEKNVDISEKWENSNNLNLMDDFLEMEKLASQSDISNGTIPGSTENLICEDGKSGVSAEATFIREQPSGEQNSVETKVSSKEDKVVASPQLHADPSLFDTHDALHQHALNNNFVETGHHSGRNDEITALREIDDNSCVKTLQAISPEMKVAISQICNFILILGKEAKAVLGKSPDGKGLNKNLSIFSAKYSNAMDCDIDLNDFLLNVSHVLSIASELQFHVLGFRNAEVETSSSDYIDKIVLPENKDVEGTSGEKYPNGCARFSDSASDPDVQIDANLVPTSEKSSSAWRCSLEEFEELKREKNNLEDELLKCTENLETTKTQLLETEQLLTVLKSQLASAQKSNSLAETQLKCMAESYKSLEEREEKLRTEVNLHKGKIESLENELQEERRSHQNSFNRCTDLQEQLDRIKSAAATDADSKTHQELAAAAEKLAECQETIYVLGKQLKALRPQTDNATSPDFQRSRKVEAFLDDGSIVKDMKLHEIDPEVYAATPSHSHRIGLESPSHVPNPTFSPSDSEPDLPRSPYHRPSKSVSSSVSSTPTPEKHIRGFSRFFSSKAKYDH
ncbi:filament-like plant protein 4 isoform X2 [Andrographis paniculata]|uniref:filament-like plant protein 4 isoform X2 n=1 Tax=Andrographis paniculata TaxID=175694 RepID=UPI0021E6FED7|nr:filament-like plant protein 4 isoform X2 [Andrographis paniculata]